MYVLSKLSLEKMKNVHPELVDVIKTAIENSPYDFRITAGARTAEEQNYLYQQGRTRAGQRVTNCDGYGHAVDIFPCGIYENGVYRKFTTDEGYDDKKLKSIANHILAIAKSKNVNIEWGGNWKMHDTPHFELK